MLALRANALYSGPRRSRFRQHRDRGNPLDPYDILREDYERTVQAATESLEPVIPTSRESGLLGLPRHAPAMLIRRMSTDQTGSIVELSHLLLRGDRSRFLLERRVRDGWPGAPTAAGDDAPLPGPDHIAASLLADA